jgi:hypothetical protein
MIRLNSITSMILKRFFPLFFLLFFMQIIIFAEINLSSSPDNTEFPAVAVNSRGEVMVVWTEWGNKNMFYRIYRNGQWSQMRNAGIVRQRAWSNQLAVDSQGTFHVAYADGIASETRDIYYSYFTGSGWATPERLYYSPYNSAWNRIDIDTNDRIHVAWYHDHTPKEETGSNIVTMSKNRMGQWPAYFENVSRSPSLLSIHPALAVKGGHVYVCWMEGPGRLLYFCEKTAGGWTNPIQIAKRGYYPDMEVDSSGNIYIVFSNRSGNLYCISRINGSWTNQQVLSNGDAPLQFGDLHYNNNMLVAAWVQRADGRVGVYGATKLPGNTWTPPLKVGDAGEVGEGKQVQVAVDRQGLAHFVWRRIGVGGNFDTFYEKRSLETPKDATFIEVDKSYLHFQTDDNTSNPSPQTFRVRASGVGSINYTLSNNKSWLRVSPMQGASSYEWISHTVSVDVSGLSDGSYNGTITITDPDAYNNPVEVNIALTVGEEPIQGDADIKVDKSNLDFSMEEKTNPAAKSFNLRATGGKSLGFKISTNKPWLSVYPNQGTAGESWISVSVSINAEDKRPGTYNGRITISATGSSGGQAHVLVSLKIEERNAPFIHVSKSHLNFWGYAKGDNPSSQTFIIKNSGSLILNYQITANKDWIKVNPTKGDSRGEADTIEVSIDNSGLGVNKFQGKIQIKAPGAENSPQNLSVAFDAVLPPQPYPPVAVAVKKINHEGLILQEYKSEISWRANPRNQGLFDIVKYRIYRKDKNQGSAYVYLDEIAANIFTYYDSGFSSKTERNKYIYSVVGVDIAGRESTKGEALVADDISPSVSQQGKDLNKKNMSHDRKNP